MNKIITVIYFLFTFTSIYSQKNYVKLPNINTNCPTYIINNDIISDDKIIVDKRKLVTEISVLKRKINRKEYKFFNLSENGIILIDLNDKIPFKTQAELNIFLGLPKNNEVYINGYLLEDSEYKIATISIKEIELIEPNTINKLKTKVINVWTLTPKERANSCSKQNVK